MIWMDSQHLDKKKLNEMVMSGYFNDDIIFNQVQVPKIYKSEDDSEIFNYMDMYLSGYVDDKLYNKFIDIENIIYSDKTYVFNILDEIRIHISSPGGFVDSGFRICEFLMHWNNDENNRPKISFVCEGNNASMAIPIISCGYRRYGYDSSTFLIHDISCGLFGRFDIVEDNFNHISKLRELTDNIIKSNTKLNKQKLDKLNKRESYFGINEAIDYGLIDIHL